PNLFLKRYSLYYRRFQAAPILRQFVRYYWTASADRRRSSILDHGVILEGSADLVFNLGDQVTASDSGGIFVNKESSVVIGPFDRFCLFHVERHFCYLGVRFHPGKVPFSSNLPLAKI